MQFKRKLSLLLLYDITEKLSLQAGIRASGYAYLGPNQINQYQEGLTKSENTLVGIKKYGNDNFDMHDINFWNSIISNYIVIG